MAAEYIGGQSAWIKKLVEPSTVDESFKDGYIDMLANRTKPFSDLSWVLKGVHTPEYKYKRHRGYEQLNKDVLNSDRVRNAVEKVKHPRPNGAGLTYQLSCMLQLSQHSNLIPYGLF